MADAEDEKLQSWKDLPDDPPFLRGISRKVNIGFMVLIEMRHELSLRVQMDKVELAKLKPPKMLIGRALYWIILHELRRSENTIGLMNIKDLSLIHI